MSSKFPNIEVEFIPVSIYFMQDVIQYNTNTKLGWSIDVSNCEEYNLQSAQDLNQT